MNYRTMGKLFSGLSQTGGWACLDEFNRIDIEVLSVVAQQLLGVRQALLQQSAQFVFEGEQIPLRSTFGCMITMNPGYAGRTELPENLKVLFRPVSMMIPDYALIAELMLFAEGFTEASSLAKKMVRLYKLSSEQLSQQDHYDFGMRAVKSVLVMAGALKRAEPDQSEQVVLIKAMKNANEAKFLSADLPLFSALVDDLFPAVAVPASVDLTLESAIERATIECGLQPIPSFTLKVRQLYETMTVRFGVMLVGDTGAGKSECHVVLAAALNLLHAHHSPPSPQHPLIITSSLNPKSISMDELYGSVSPLTQEWSDGLASSIMRRAMDDHDLTHHHWIHFDGPVDALWIESMNTVLDDNATLCLVNGERMKLKAEMRMLFEVSDLSVASPATVSRCGMVYMTAQDMGVMPAVQSWMTKQLQSTISPQLFQHIEAAFILHLPSALTFLRQHCTETVLTSDMQLAKGTSKLFQALLTEALNTNQTHNTMTTASHDSHAESRLEGPTTSSASPSVDGLCGVVDLLVCFSVCWGVGGGLEGADADTFQRWLSSRFAGAAPSSGSLFDFYVDLTERQWRPWADRVAPFTYSASVPYYQLLVPTVTSVKYQTLMSQCIAVQGGVYFTGGSGVGKSVLINDQFNSPSSSRAFSLISLTFSAQSTAKQTQDTIEGKLVKYRKNLLGPQNGVTGVIFIDDINLCGAEVFGAQPPVELLRQWREYGGWYDRDKLFFKQLTNCVLVCAAAPARGGGRHEITRRLLKHFNLFTLPQPSESVLCHIFNSILGGVLTAFKPSVYSLRDELVQATVTLYSTLSHHLLPSPAKSHYTFNLRDVSAVVGGIAQIQPAQCSTPDTMVRLWVHECQRQFSDRLVDDDDRRWFHQAVHSLAISHFPSVPLTVDEVQSTEQPILFADWLKPAGEKVYTQHVYHHTEQHRVKGHVEDTTANGNGDIGESTAPTVQHAGDATQSTASSSSSSSASSPLSRLLDDYLLEFNESSQSVVQLVFFPSAVAHVSRLSRILRQPRGHALLVGVGGSGKQSYTRLSAFMAGMACMTLSGGKGYGYAEFQADLRRVLTSAGQEGKPTVLMVNDHQITEERFLEDINALLNGGDVANLFTGDDLTVLLDSLLPVARDAGLPINRESIYSLFVSRVTSHLHVVLCMSPIGPSFRVRCRQFPSLINCTTIDWYEKWPTSALQQVATRMLSEVQLNDEGMRRGLVEACVTIHCSVEDACDRFGDQLRRHVYTTPKSYLDWLQLFLTLLDERRAALHTSRQHFLSGLTKLRETQATVAELQETLTALQPVLLSKAEESSSLMDKISVDAAKAAAVRSQVESEEAIVNTAAVEVRELTASAQADLDAALPALKSALKSLEKLKKAEISEVKSMASPPSGVVKTMEMVCLLCNATPDWDTAKKVLANVNFLKELQTFDKDNIDQKVIRKLTKYTADPELTEERMNQVSRAGAALLSWVLAMMEYSKVNKVVGPKKEKLAELNAALTEKESQLTDKQNQLKAVQDALDALQAQLTRAQAEKAELDDKSALTAARLERAEKLIGGLGGEEVRWKAEAEKLQSQLDFVVGDVFLSTAAIAYYGPFTGEFRHRLVERWKSTLHSAHIPLSPDVSLQATLAVPYEVRSWLSNGLPTDGVSIDSAIVIKKCARWPLCIDPQEQAKKWIKAESRQRLIVTRMSAKDTMRVIEMAIKTGSTLLIEDVGEVLDSAIDPVLNKAVYSRGVGRYIRLGDTEVEYNDKFRLLLTTKLPNPHYLPESQIKVTLLNFTVTRSGLEEQLLGEVVKRERPDVEEKTNKLIAMLAKDKRQLSEIEDKILHLLSTTEGNLLDNVPLIDTLEESKFTSHVIADRVKDNLATQLEMARIRELYRSVAVRGAILFFLMQDLAVVDPMYQFSLHFFMRLFHSGLIHSPQSDNLVERLALLLTHLTLLLFSSVNRGLFERHKLAFAFQLAVAIEREEGSISTQQWKAFVMDEAAFVDHATVAVQAKSEGSEVVTSNPFAPAGLLSSGAWDWLHSLGRVLPPFRGLCDDMAATPDSLKQWSEYLTCDSPAQSTLPGQWSGRLHPFLQLLLLRGLRSSHLHYGCAQYVSSVLGSEYASAPPSSLDDVMVSSDCRTPLLFILSQGADPTALLSRFAHDKRRVLTMLSLGQGQGEVATSLIANAQVKGEWVCLSNLHLGKSWLPTLEEIVERLSEAEEGVGGASVSGVGGVSRVHPDFRLFFTSMPCDYFPVAVLQKSVKLTNEPPAGLRNNLIRSYTQIVNRAELDGEAQEPTTTEEDTDNDTSAPSSSTGLAPATPSPCPPSFKKLLFGLIFFHGLVQERRSFGPIGFVNFRSLEWNDSDLETSIATLKLILTQASQHQQPIPLDALKYVVGEIHYGGRVTDESDRRLISTMLERFFTERILDSSYTFSPSGLYFAPPDGQLSDYLNYIEALPTAPLPEVFAMHSNATLTLQKQESSRLMDTLRVMQPRDGAGAGEGEEDDDNPTAATSAAVASPDTVLINKAQQILASLPALLSRDGAAVGLFSVNSAGVLPSLSVVLVQEMDRFNRLLQCMSSSLIDLQRAVRGELIMSASLDDVAHSLINNVVPQLWSSLAYPSLAPLHRWLVDLTSRVDFFARWLSDGPPSTYWLSAFFFPQGFLTAVLQHHARKTQQPIDGLTWTFTVLDQQPTTGHAVDDVDGVMIRGLFCEGGRWDAERRVLDDARDGELRSEMPAIHFRPSTIHNNALTTPIPTSSSSSPSFTYPCPVYKTSLRAGQLSTTGQSTNFVLSVDLPTAHSPSYWTLRGTAILCQPD